MRACLGRGGEGKGAAVKTVVVADRVIVMGVRVVVG